jgi:ADP-ribose pyrophosphatase
MKAGERPEAAAARELAEETGYRPGRLERVQGFFPINGISPHHAHVFLAHDCVATGSGTEHEATERMSVHVLGAELVRSKLLAGEIEDGFALIGLFHHFLRAGS